MRVEIETFDVPFEMSKSGYCCKVVIDGNPIPANPRRLINRELSWFSSIDSAFNAVQAYFFDERI